MQAFLSLAQKLSPSPDAELLARDLCRDDLPSADLVVAGYVLAEIPAAAQHAVVDKLFEASRDALISSSPERPKASRASRRTDDLIAKGANVLGPCTHANACPMAGTDWCHFSQRLPRSRDHMHAKGASVPYEDERYAWLAVRPHAGARRSRAWPACFPPPKETKPGLEFKLCTPAGLENRMIARRDKETYARVRRIAWGDVSA